MQVCRLFCPCFLQHLFDRIFQNFFILKSNALGKNFSVLKKDDRRDRHNSVAGSNITVLVYIEFADLYSSASSSITGAIIRHGPHHVAKKSTTTGISEPRTSASKFALVNTVSILFSPSIISCCIQSFSTAFAYRSGGHRKPLCRAYFFFLPQTTSFASSKHFLIRIIFRFSSILSQVACESHRFTHAHILIRHTAFPSFHVYYMQIFMTYHGGRSAYRSASLPQRTLSHTLS